MTSFYKNFFCMLAMVVAVFGHTGSGDDPAAKSKAVTSPVVLAVNKVCSMCSLPAGLGERCNEVMEINEEWGRVYNLLQEDSKQVKEENASLRQRLKTVEGEYAGLQKDVRRLAVLSSDQPEVCSGENILRSGKPNKKI